MRASVVICLFIGICLTSMGYDIHITRRANWFDEQGPSISLDEWKALLAADPEMRLDGYAEARSTAGDVVRVEKDGLAVWTGYSKHREGSVVAWLYFTRGEIVVKNPDVEIFGKMAIIASKLGARVQGDEGEFYDARGNIKK